MKGVLVERKLSSRTGSEGPRHDPYGYHEYTVEIQINGFKNVITYHCGLGEWLEINGDRIDHGSFNSWGKEYDQGTKILDNIFEDVAGFEIGKFEEYLNEIDSRNRRCCDKPRLEWVHGFPGEHLLICQTCHKIVDSQFVRSEVE